MALSRTSVRDVSEGSSVTSLSDSGSFGDIFIPADTLVICRIALRDNTAASRVISDVSTTDGLTLTEAVGLDNAGTQNSWRVAIYTAHNDTHRTDQTLTASFAGQIARAQIQVTLIQGHDADDPIGDTNTEEFLNDAAVNGAEITTTRANSGIMVAIGGNTVDTTTSPASGWTEDHDSAIGGSGLNRGIGHWREADINTVVGAYTPGVSVDGGGDDGEDWVIVAAEIKAAASTARHRTFRNRRSRIFRL